MKRLLLALVLAVVAVSGCTAPATELFEVGADGLLVSADRAVTEVRSAPLREGALAQSKVYFGSLSATVAGLLSRPEGARAAAVVLPGAGITKEMEQVGLAGKLNALGIATLTLDQRGLGETAAPAAALQADFEAFAQGKEVSIHGSVRDALGGFDVLRAAGYERIWFIGESNGGRVAIIAAAIEPRSAGVLGISTGGYQAGQAPSAEAERFLKSIDPGAYVGAIAPRPVLLVHYGNDTGIPLAMAEALFAAAGEPKQLWVLERAYHGYDDTLVPALLEREAARLTGP